MILDRKLFHQKIGKFLVYLLAPHLYTSSQEEGSRLYGDLELAVEALKFGVGSRRVRVDTVAVIDVHDHIHASAIGEKFTEVAGVVFRLLEALLDELSHRLL